MDRDSLFDTSTCNFALEDSLDRRWLENIFSTPSTPDDLKMSGQDDVIEFSELWRDAWSSGCINNNNNSSMRNEDFGLISSTANPEASTLKNPTQVTPALAPRFTSFHSQTSPEDILMDSWINSVESQGQGLLDFNRRDILQERSGQSRNYASGRDFAIKSGMAFSHCHPRLISSNDRHILSDAPCARVMDRAGEMPGRISGMPDRAGGITGRINLKQTSRQNMSEFLFEFGEARELLTNQKSISGFDNMSGFSSSIIEAPQRIIKTATTDFSELLELEEQGNNTETKNSTSQNINNRFDKNQQVNMSLTPAQDASIQIHNFHSSNHRIVKDRKPFPGVYTRTNDITNISVHSFPPSPPYTSDSDVSSPESSVIEDTVETKSTHKKSKLSSQFLKILNPSEQSIKMRRFHPYENASSLSKVFTKKKQQENPEARMSSDEQSFNFTSAQGSPVQDMAAEKEEHVMSDLDELKDDLRELQASHLKMRIKSEERTDGATRTYTLSEALFTSPPPTTGTLLLTDEEKNTLLAEGYPIPSSLPLDPMEEKCLKKVRRKIKNKMSAQESRRKKKEYMDTLEIQMQVHMEEKEELRVRVNQLEQNNRSLLQQLDSLRKLLRSNSSNSGGTCVMVIALFFAAFLGTWTPTSLSIGFSTGWGLRSNTGLAETLNGPNGPSLPTLENNPAGLAGLSVGVGEDMIVPTHSKGVTEECVKVHATSSKKTSGLVGRSRLLDVSRDYDIEDAGDVLSARTRRLLRRNRRRTFGPTTPGSRTRQRKNRRSRETRKMANDALAGLMFLFEEESWPPRTMTQSSDYTDVVSSPALPYPTGSIPRLEGSSSDQKLETDGEWKIIDEIVNKQNLETGKDFEIKSENAGQGNNEEYRECSAASKTKSDSGECSKSAYVADCRGDGKSNNDKESFTEIISQIISDSHNYNKIFEQKKFSNVESEVSFLNSNIKIGIKENSKKASAKGLKQIVHDADKIDNAKCVKLPELEKYKKYLPALYYPISGCSSWSDSQVRILVNKSTTPADNLTRFFKTAYVLENKSTQTSKIKLFTKKKKTSIRLVKNVKSEVSKKNIKMEAEGAIKEEKEKHNLHKSRTVITTTKTQYFKGKNPNSNTQSRSINDNFKDLSATFAFKNGTSKATKIPFRKPANSIESLNTPENTILFIRKPANSIPSIKKSANSTTSIRKKSVSTKNIVVLVKSRKSSTNRLVDKQPAASESQKYSISSKTTKQSSKLSTLVKKQPTASDVNKNAAVLTNKKRVEVKGGVTISSMIGSKNNSVDSVLLKHSLVVDVSNSTGKIIISAIQSK